MPQIERLNDKSYHFNHKLETFSFCKLCHFNSSLLAVVFKLVLNFKSPSNIAGKELIETKKIHPTTFSFSMLNTSIVNIYEFCFLKLFY